MRKIIGYEEYIKLKIHLRLARADLDINLHDWVRKEKGNISDWMCYLCPEFNPTQTLWREYIKELTDDNEGFGILKRYSQDKKIYMIDSEGYDINQKYIINNFELNWLTKFLDIKLSYSKGTERKAIRFPI